MSVTHKPEAATVKRFAVKPPPTEDEAVAGIFREEAAKARAEADLILAKTHDAKRLGQEERLAELMRHRSIKLKVAKVMESAAIPCADRIVAQAAQVSEAAKAQAAKGKA